MDAKELRAFHLKMVRAQEFNLARLASLVAEHLEEHEGREDTEDDYILSKILDALPDFCINDEVPTPLEKVRHLVAEWERGTPSRLRQAEAGYRDLEKACADWSHEVDRLKARLWEAEADRDSRYTLDEVREEATDELLWENIVSTLRERCVSEMADGICARLAALREPSIREQLTTTVDKPPPTHTYGCQCVLCRDWREVNKIAEPPAPEEKP